MEFTVDICNLCALKYLRYLSAQLSPKKKKKKREMQNTMMKEEGLRECVCVGGGDEEKRQKPRMGTGCEGTLTYPTGGKKNITEYIDFL